MPTIYVGNDPINHNLQRKRSLKGITRLQIGIYNIPEFLFRSQATKWFSIGFHYNVSTSHTSPNIHWPNWRAFLIRLNLDTLKNAQKMGGHQMFSCFVGPLKVDTVKFAAQCSEYSEKQDPFYFA